ncbi:TonB-dependent receptor [Sphingobium sp.]|uniref:TonB-dependent receptor n=1 Tax=Sphingobium sp. TaxID=1912891 RepID=UPI0028BE8A23|nr:TonB-dependent receptor [Sphingobium sp.]
MLYRTTLLFSGAVMMLGLSPAVAWAQQADQGASDGQLQDIVVTAQRRSERLQDVPIAVSALTGDQALAAGITGTATIQASVPSLVVARTANSATPFLRGIGSTIGDANAESSVAIYLDGVYQPAAYGNFFEFNNIERIEVLKGPQGTLFGRNATGGVIQVITKDPSDKLESAFDFGYANYETVTANAYLSVPVSDTLAFNLSGSYLDQNEGWGANLIDGTPTRNTRNYGVRGKFMFTPTDRTTIKLSGSYQHSVNPGINSQNIAGSQTLLGQTYPGDFNTWSDHKSISRNEVKAVALHVDQDFDAFRFVNITSYNKTTGYVTVDGDQSSADLFFLQVNQLSKTFTQEVQLLSRSDSRFQWVVGGYYYDRNVSQFAQNSGSFLPLPTGLDQFANTKVRSKSLFAQGTYPITDGTNLTAGFRYSWEKIKGTATNYIGGTSIPLGPVGTTASFDYGKPTWRLSLDHKFAPDIMGYVSYNRGTKSGNYGMTGGPAGLSQPYQPEEIDAYEAGVKSQLFDRRVRLNAAIFHYDFKNYQFQKYVGGAAFVFNGPSAKTTGGEIELEIKPTRRLTLTGNVGILDTKIGDFAGAPNSCRPFATNVPDVGGFFCDPVTGGSGTVPFNARGNRLPNAAKLSGNAGFSYEIPTANGTFLLTGSAYHFGGAPAAVDNRLYYRKYTTFNGSIGWTDARDQFSLRLWGKNLSNEYYYQQLGTSPGLADFGSPAAPRTYGVTIGYKFP